jgi:hypothetical protein
MRLSGAKQNSCDTTPIGLRGHPDDRGRSAALPLPQHAALKIELLVYWKSFFRLKLEEAKEFVVSCLECDTALPRKLLL